MPDVNYNKSPIIRWLDYKKLPPPHNLKYPKNKTYLEKRNPKTGKIEKVHMHL